MALPGAIVSVGCPAGSTNDPRENPYLAEFAVVLVLLWAVFVLWRRVRPRPRRPLRWYAGAGGAVAFVVMGALVTVEVDPANRASGCRVVFEAALFAAASLALEILLSWRRRRVPPARVV